MQDFPPQNASLQGYSYLAIFTLLLSPCALPCCAPFEDLDPTIPDGREWFRCLPTGVNSFKEHNYDLGTTALSYTVLAGSRSVYGAGLFTTRVPKLWCSTVPFLKLLLAFLYHMRYVVMLQQRRRAGPEVGSGQDTHGRGHDNP